MFTLTISLFGILPILPVVHQLVRPGQWSAEQVENKQTHTWASGYERHTGTLPAASEGVHMSPLSFLFFAHANFTVFYFMCRWAIFAIVLILMKILHLVPGAGRAPACLPACLPHRLLAVHATFWKFSPCGQIRLAWNMNMKIWPPRLWWRDPRKK